MKSISLKLSEEILIDTDDLIGNLSISRNRYINEAIDFYNQHQRRQLLKEQLNKESELIRKDSLEVLHEFENLADELE
ncbi:MAG: hypothetical protein AB8G22_00895 [Saprospiraceae bacterium]